MGRAGVSGVHLAADRTAGAARLRLPIRIVYDLPAFPAGPRGALGGEAGFIRPSALQRSEALFALAIPAALWLFFGGVQYTRLQYGTGVRYLAPVFPFLFIAASTVLLRLPRRISLAAGVAAVAQAWSMAMYRDVERGWGLAEPLKAVFSHGLQLPALGVLSKIEGPYAGYFKGGAAVLVLYLLTAMVICLLWRGAALPAFRDE